MKKIKVLLSILFFSQILNAQTYIPLHLDVGTCWKSIRYVNSSFNGNRTLTEHTIVEKDTLINNTKYYKTLKNIIDTASLGELIFYFRNDTLNKKVYSYENGIDVLKYDFNLTIGDTIPGTDWIIDTVGTEQSFGISRNFYGLKTLYFDGNPEVLFYEGIGESRSAFMTFKPYQLTGPGGGFVYVSKISCGFYGTPIFGDSIMASICFPLGNKDIIDIEKFIKIYPNPANDFLMIDFSSQMQNNYEIKLMDLFGNTIIQKICTEVKTKISLQGLNNQLYILQVKYKDNIQQFKILKQ